MNSIHIFLLHTCVTWEFQPLNVSRCIMNLNIEIKLNYILHKIHSNIPSFFIFRVPFISLEFES